MKQLSISIAKDFSDTPGGRFIKEGAFSGEEFRERILKPKYKEAVASGANILVDLDGCMGYPSSFLDESFGKLSREFPNENVYEKFQFISQDQPGLVDVIKKMME